MNPFFATPITVVPDNDTEALGIPEDILHMLVGNVVVSQGRRLYMRQALWQQLKPNLEAATVAR